MLHRFTASLEKQIYFLKNVLINIDSKGGITKDNNENVSFIENLMEVK